MSFPDRPGAEPEPAVGPITAALAQLKQGMPGAADRLAELVYQELHRIAERAMRRERDGHTLQPTGLVSEAFMRLVDQDRVDWRSRAHFFAVAAQTIRRILVDHARARGRIKRDHGIRVTLDEGAADGETVQELDLIALDSALSQLHALAPRPARVVELRYFGGLEIEEAAEALGISPATVKRDWTFARAFLLRALDPGPA